MANPFVNGIISVTLGVIMLTSVFIPQVKGVNTSGYTSAEVALFGTITIAGIIGIVYGTFAVFGLV